jgi:uncharacterized protein (DUF4415 family)
VKKRAAMTKHSSLSESQSAQLRAAEFVTPNTTDIPEASFENWPYARKFFKTRKEAISLTIDADVLDWLRRRGEHYQSEINRILRERMESEISQ